MGAEAELVDLGGRRLVIGRARPGEEGWRYDARLQIETGAAVVEVWDLDDGLVAFFADLAALWRGFGRGEALEQHREPAGLRATAQTVGEVDLVVALGQPWPPGWALEATFTVGAGAHLERFADALLQVFAR